MKNYAVVLLLCSLFVTVSSLADIRSQGEQEKRHDKFNEEWAISFSGMADFRLVHTGTERNWQSPSLTGPGGWGRTRYGGKDTDQDALGDTDATEFHLAQVSLLTDIRYTKTYFARLQLNFDDHPDENDRTGNFGVPEAYIGANFSLCDRWGLRTRFGQVFPLISFEHSHVAWTTRYTITPSAINSWVSEELRPTGAEFLFKWDLDPYFLEFLFMPFSRNDTAGTVLSLRGWALHDWQARTGARLRVNQSTMAPNGHLSDPFKEIDGVLSYLAGFNFEYNRKLRFRFLHWDQTARQNSRDVQNDYAWNTRFESFGLEWTPNANLVLLHQYLFGKTQMGPDNSLAVNNDIWSWYLLASYAVNSHRLSIRYDQFGVTDLEATVGDDNNSRGEAWTFAYTYGFADLHSVAIEYLHVHSQRTGNDGLNGIDPDDNQFQFVTRLYF